MARSASVQELLGLGVLLDLRDRTARGVEMAKTGLQVCPALQVGKDQRDRRDPPELRGTLVPRGR